MHHKKIFKQRGQVLILYALLIPAFLFCMGVGLDMGWYYLNVSRLQNAADAAAVAGARAIRDDDENADKFNGYSKKVRLVDKFYTADDGNETNAHGDDIDIDSGNDEAKEYALKNLSADQDATLLASTDNSITYTLDSDWSKSSTSDARKIKLEASLYKDGGKNFYYVVSLREKIEHLFLPGFFDPMDAPVLAVAKISKDSSDDDDETEDSNDPVITEKEQEKLEETINANVIVGNWEVQNYYRNQSSSTKNGTKTYTYYRAEAYKARLGRELYTGAWNHFQDLYNHFKQGSHIRTETVVVQDDLVVSGTSIVRYGENSNVVATKATINNDPSSPSYNPEVTDKKTYASYATGGDANPQQVGRPFIWQRLESINIDFVPDVQFKNGSKYLSEDWDISLYSLGIDKTPYSTATGWSAHTSWEDGADRSYLRIHNSISFEAPYKAREDADDPDVLWGRIESEAMLYHPDAGNDLEGNVKIQALNSVRQIIINFNQSNFDTTAQKYRPVILFYDGPERYSEDNTLRDSLPIILNINAPFRSVLYAPNSPVVIVGNHQNDFHGFVVAKKYMRLKTANEFEFAYYRYYKSATRKEEYFRTDSKDKNGNVIFRDANGKNDRTESQLYVEEVYLAKSGGTTEYYKLIEDGIEMFIDTYGNVQYADLSNPPTKCGTYDNFGRTEFTTHNYKVEQSSANNLLLSSN